MVEVFIIHIRDNIMTELKVTFLSAVGELHPNQQFLMRCVMDGELTED